MAMSLNNLAGMQAGLGREEEALELAREATALYRSLAVQHPERFRPELAKSLNNVAITLRALKRPADALLPAEDATELYRGLVKELPAVFGPDHAKSLNTLSNILGDLRRSAEALALAREVVDQYRALTEQKPDTFTREFAGALNNLANRLLELDRGEEALAAAAEATELYRGLADKNPGVQPDLAVSLAVMAGCLDAVQHWDEGMTANEAAIAELSEPFHHYPAVFTDRMTRMVQDYLHRCERFGRIPNKELLGPIEAELEALRRD
jgi:hypothetical protein